MRPIPPSHWRRSQAPAVPSTAHCLAVRLSGPTPPTRPQIGMANFGFFGGGALALDSSSAAAVLPPPRVVCFIALPPALALPADADLAPADVEPAAAFLPDHSATYCLTSNLRLQPL